MENENKKSNKLIILIVTIVILMLLVVGVVLVYKNKNSNQSNDVQSPGESTTSTTNEKDTNTKVSGKLTDVYHIAGKDIYINVPSWQKIDQGYTKVFIINGKKYIAVTCEKHSEGTAFEDAHNIAFEKFKRNIQNYSYVNYLTAEKEEIKTVNGIKVYRFEGKLNCGHDTIYDAYAVGYSFIMDDAPCIVIGSVIDKEQPQAEIDEMRETVDAMIKTLRNNE